MLSLSTILLIPTGIGWIILNKMEYNKWTLLNNVCDLENKKPVEVLRGIQAILLSATLLLGIFSLIRDLCAIILA